MVEMKSYHCLVVMVPLPQSVKYFLLLQRNWRLPPVVAAAAS